MKFLTDLTYNVKFGIDLSPIDLNQQSDFKT